MTLGQIFYDGFLDDESKNIMASLKAVSLLSLYIINTEEEYNCLFPLSGECSGEMGRRILNDMVKFSYFIRIGISEPVEIFKHLYTIKVKKVILKHVHWIGTYAPYACVKNGILIYPEKKKNGTVVHRKISLLRLYFRKPQSWMELVLKELNIKS